MANPFRHPNNGAPGPAWSKNARNERNIYNNPDLVSNAPPPDPSTLYHSMTSRCYHSSSLPLPPYQSQAQLQNNFQNTAALPAVQSYHGVSSYRPTDPRFFPQYYPSTSSPDLPHRLAKRQKHDNPQQRIPGPSNAPYGPLTRAPDPEPRYIRAVQTSPGQYIPTGAAATATREGAAPVDDDGPRQPIHTVPPEETPFVTPGGTSSSLSL